jgi:hypothetical protein
MKSLNSLYKPANTLPPKYFSIGLLGSIFVSHMHLHIYPFLLDFPVYWNISFWNTPCDPLNFMFIVTLPFPFSFFFFFFCGTGNRIRTLLLARKVLYQLSQAPVLLVLVLLSDRVLCFFLGLASDYKPPTFIKWVDGIIGMHQHT